MTSERSKDLREVIFVNEAARDAYMSLPNPVREMADAFMTALQNGRRMPSNRYRLLDKNLAGIGEFRIPYDSDTYRCYQYVQKREVIYVLDAGMKKSPRAGQIPNEDVARLEHRMALALKAYETDKDRLAAEYDHRNPQQTQSASHKPKGH